MDDDEEIEDEEDATRSGGTKGTPAARSHRKILKMRAILSARKAATTRTAKKKPKRGKKVAT